MVQWTETKSVFKSRKTMNVWRGRVWSISSSWQRVITFSMKPPPGWYLATVRVSCSDKPISDDAALSKLEPWSPLELKWSNNGYCSTMWSFLEDKETGETHFLLKLYGLRRRSISSKQLRPAWKDFEPLHRNPAIFLSSAVVRLTLLPILMKTQVTSLKDSQRGAL